MLLLSGGVFLGWALGANHAANVFGTAVASRMIRYRTAILLGGLCVLLGAIAEGGTAMEKLAGLSPQKNPQVVAAFIITAVTGLTVVLATGFKLPVSTSQAIIGSIIGMALWTNPTQAPWTELSGIVACWVGTPIGAAIVAAILYPTLGWVMDHLPTNLVDRSIYLKWALLISGAYGAYALGANNVANTTAVFLHTGILKNVPNPMLVLTLVGGASMAVGILTSSKRVMFTIGAELVQLGAFSAFISVLSAAITLHFYAVLGVPVSSSQAIVGGVLGIGIAKGMKTINRKTLIKIILAWVLSPTLAGAVCYGLGMLAVKP